MLNKLPPAVLGDILSRYWLPNHNSLPELLNIALVSKNFYVVVLGLLRSDHTVRSKVSPFFTRFLLRLVAVCVSRDCRGHPLTDMLQNSSMSSNPYFSLRWLLYDTLPSIYLDKERTYFNGLYTSPLPLKYYWSIQATRTRAKRVFPYQEGAGGTVKYIKRQLMRKSSRVGRILNSWYYNQWFDRAIADMLRPHCSFCFKSISGLKLPDMYCIICRTSDTYTHPPINKPGEQFACVNYLVPVCKECLEEEEKCRSLRYPRHCPLSNQNCLSYRNGWQGCLCECHTEGMQEFEYIGFKRRRMC